MSFCTCGGSYISPTGFCPVHMPASLSTTSPAEPASYTDEERKRAWPQLPVPQNRVWELQADINRLTTPSVASTQAIRGLLGKDSGLAAWEASQAAGYERGLKDAFRAAYGYILGGQRLAAGQSIDEAMRSFLTVPSESEGEVEP